MLAHSHHTAIVYRQCDEAIVYRQRDKAIVYRHSSTQTVQQKTIPFKRLTAYEPRGRF